MRNVPNIGWWLREPQRSRSTTSDVIVEAGKAIDIAVGAAHRVENPGAESLVFIEVQRGGYLGEDDIVRLQDDFGRAAEKKDEG